MAHELIVYATPTNTLAAQCSSYWMRAVALGPTAAQAYPPHCTLTGFFHRDDEGRSHAAEVVAEAIHSSFLRPGIVTVEGLVRLDNWVGLQLDSPWLVEWTRELIGRLPPGPDEDELRLKTWPHLSLAYDVIDLDPYEFAAHELIDPNADASWEIGLWERSDGNWTRLV